MRCCAPPLRCVRHRPQHPAPRDTARASCPRRSPSPARASPSPRPSPRTTPQLRRQQPAPNSTLFSLTNSDRASNGVPSLTYNGTLAAIGEGARYGGCGFTVYGRSVDMIQRDYFAHPIKSCGQLVFSMMSAFGVHYRSAGENIGWVSGESSGYSSADYINGQFMNSPDHRANILDRNYTSLGVGSDESAPGVYWTGAGSPGYQNVWMFSEEFAQLGNSSPPPPPPPPPHRSHHNPPRNSPAPPGPAQPPATSAPVKTPSPTATPQIVATPTPLPSGVLPLSVAIPPVIQYQGFLAGSVESVLASFLIS